ncbi:HRSL1 enzyme, partial [Certhia familiaris]|nr:HRSL1 enzyme [Certhia familiaris]
MTDDKQYPKPGDLIEIKRGIFQHWAVYAGDGNVIHAITADDNSLPVSSGIEGIFARKALVKKHPLKNVAKEDEWRINNKYDRSRTPLPVEEIIPCAERWINREVPYNVLGSNCEHFVTRLRYGEGVSDQV